MHHWPGDASQPHMTETGWKDWSGGSTVDSCSDAVAS